MLYYAKVTKLLCFRETRKNQKIPIYLWNVEKGKIDIMAFESTEHIIHLAGAGIADKLWTNGAVTTNKIFAESDPPADDFLGKTCKQWEDAAGLFSSLNSRSVKIRTGIVLAKDGGALKRMTFHVKPGLGSSLGTGKHYFPWIHIDDFVNVFIFALKNIQMKGQYNAVATEEINYNNFMKTFAAVLYKPYFMPNISALILKLMLGEMSKMLLEGSRISNKKLLITNFKFKFFTLANALKDLLIKFL